MEQLKLALLASIEVQRTGSGGDIAASMFGGPMFPLLLGGRGAAYAGLGLLGGATIGLAVHHFEDPRRQLACFVGAGLVAAAIFGLVRGARGGTVDAT